MIVYILPKENYAGITNTKFKARLKHHKKPSIGKDIEGARILYEGLESECRELEDFLHADHGFNGRHKYYDRNAGYHLSGTEVHIDGITYKSIREASAKTGITRYKIWKNYVGK